MAKARARQGGNTPRGTLQGDELTLAESPNAAISSGS